ncbi:hypothetical protein H0I23_05110 [Cellulophaga sp. HaHaR_3_176]|uniref:hypothetical protein n=1 Tax=Cellulophaga sp. HaHaR_3_176 TaxID=1942464 RepID=UPI001C1FDD29|nr:hypothetical protein [Cellulophaga sp. HaHaR_3_176]QWX85018.1 hypothetical protein H0I23_05110 [Cellulophaga sp. HaHaR_3_176]
MAYFVFKDTKKAIKAYNKNIKGSACFDTSSRLYENGDLEVTESNCDEKSILRKHYKI